MPRNVLIETRRSDATSVSYPDARGRTVVIPARPSSAQVMRSAQRLFLSPMGTVRTTVTRALGRWGGRRFFRDGPVLQRVRAHGRRHEQLIARVTIARSETRMTAAFLDGRLRPTAFAKIVGRRSAAAIRNEYTWLSRLSGVPAMREQIPSPLRCWEMQGVTVLELLPLEYAPRSSDTFSDAHERFLAQLHYCSQQYSGQGEPMLARIHRRLRKPELVISAHLREALTAAAGDLRQRWADQQRRVVAHGDFTPWNVLMDSQRIRVVDWESVVEDCPPLYDYFHFTMFPRAVRNAVRSADLSRVLGRSSSSAIEHAGKESASRQFLAYLLDVITSYLDADDGRNEQSALVQQYARLLTTRCEWLR